MRSKRGPLRSNSLILGAPGFFSLGGVVSWATDFFSSAGFCFLDYICLLSAMAWTIGRPPTLWLHAPARPLEPPTAGGRGRRLLYPEPRLLPVSPRRRNPCIRRERRWRGETRGDAASLLGRAESARRRAEPDSGAPDRAADFSASTKSWRPLPENVSRPRSRR